MGFHGHLVNYNWHDLVKQLGIEEAVSGMWYSLSSVLQQHGLSSGWIPFRFDEAGQFSGYGPYSLYTRQNGILRFNCADSLDRTNMAIFCMSFYFVPVCIFLFACPGMSTI